MNNKGKDRYYSRRAGDNLNSDYVLDYQFEEEEENDMSFRRNLPNQSFKKPKMILEVYQSSHKQFLNKEPKSFS